MAHLSLCFRSQVQVPALRLAIEAYERAAELQCKNYSHLGASQGDPDLDLDPEAIGRMGTVRMREMHFNRGIALRFDGRYDQALKAFRLAQSDPRLPVKAEVATTKRRVVQISTALKRASRQRAL